ncbi:Lactate dehydrogenase [Tistlia consotensis]|uniref:Lactate dehydrogenase n=1 Tax=Tistlia consotensis USBA 355 TaxID=560819 RepID=A0A1Y6CKS0_9PROT|nr:2-hydroxyacid dehydrogenase [Tistlia consotensis]SMF73680.1 Lactate dehydrogenase [Tistlia consotensis USBA 355]SNS28468.1 Lactate dehydrogenase [Tistlia consotensis]
MPPEIAVISSTIVTAPDLLDRLKSHFTVHLMHEPGSYDAEAAKRCRAITTSGGTRVDAGTFDAFPEAGLVASFGVGYDSIDVAEAKRRGIRVTNTPGVLTDEVADLAIGLAIAVCRDLVTGDAYVRSGAWERQGALPLKRKVSGMRAGILGLGGIGLAIARRAAAFDMDLAWSGPRPKPDQPLPYLPSAVELAARSDLLFVCCPGGAETRHLVNAEVLKALGPEGYLINVARGSVVDERALVAALEAGSIAGAGLDVFEEEPKVPEALKNSPKVVLQPHVGSATVATRRAMGDLVFRNLEAWFAGRELVTPVA